MEDLLRHGPGLRQIVERGQQRRRGLRQREEFRGDLGDHPQGPPGSDHELRHVVSGDVLHGLPAEGDDVAVGQDRFEPQKQIPGGAIEIPPGPAPVGGDDAADGRLFHVGRIKGEERTLAGTGQLLLHRRQGDPRFHGEAQVGDVVLGNPVDPQHRQHHVELSGNPAGRHLGAVAARHDGQFFRAGIRQQFRDFFHASGVTTARGAKPSTA